MKNDKLKKGFTLAEAITTLAIIGILATMSMAVIRPQEERGSKYLYTNALRALELAYYNGTLRGHNPFNLPEDATANDQVAAVCKAISSYINTTDNVKTADTVNENGELVLGDDFDAACKSDSVKYVTPTAISLREDRLLFTANNDMKFYITRKVEGKGDDAGFNFFVVFIDINGDKAPNSILASASPNGIPDIYAFALVSGGRVVPLGIPEYDTRLLTAKFAYYDDSGDPLFDDRTMAYYQAKNAAWGFYGEDCENDANESEPYTLNDKIRRIINTNYKTNLIYKNFPNLESANYSKPGVQEDETHNCSPIDLEACYVVIDEYQSY